MIHLIIGLGFPRLFRTKLNRVPILHVIHILPIDVHVFARGSGLLTVQIKDFGPSPCRNDSTSTLGPNTAVMRLAVVGHGFILIVEDLMEESNLPNI